VPHGSPVSAKDDDENCRNKTTSELELQPRQLMFGILSDVPRSGYYSRTLSDGDYASDRRYESARLLGVPVF
jgi:hypothetical protein